MKKPSALFQEYSQKIHAARVGFMQSSGLNFFMGETSPKKLHQFLLLWTGLSIKMTEQVEHWIRRAGESTQKLGQSEVGEMLVHHASQEAEHDQLLVKDLHFLVNKWNALYHDTLTESDITSLATPSFTQAYVDLHEQAIIGDKPYTQVAIEFEIERISVHYGPRMIENVLNTLGYEFEEGLSFLVDHVLLDQGHTKFNTHLLEKCLEAGGDVSALAETGGQALRIYAGFLNECLNLTQKIFENQTWKSQITI